MFPILGVFSSVVFYVLIEYSYKRHIGVHSSVVNPILYLLAGLLPFNKFFLRQSRPVNS